MKMSTNFSRKFVWIVFCAFTTRFAYAQTLDVYFKSQPGHHSDKDFGPGPTLRADTARGQGGAAVVTRYFPSGQKQEELPFADVRHDKLHGTQTRWFENGQVQATEQYADNHRHGVLLTHYPDGTLRRREEYRKGKQVKAECFGPDGRLVAYFDYLQFPAYPGGLPALLDAIRSRTTYPEAALNAYQTGRVFVDFIVDKTGVVQQARVRQSIAPLLDAEALRVVNSLTGWAPGRLDGEPADVLFTLPVTFAIR